MNAATADGWANLNQQQHGYNIRREIHEQNQHNARLLAALGMLSNPPPTSAHDINPSESGILGERHPLDCECGECETDDSQDTAENEVHPPGCRCDDCKAFSLHMNGQGNESLAPGIDEQPQSQVKETDSEVRNDESAEFVSRLDGYDHRSAENAAETDYGSFQDGGTDSQVGMTSAEIADGHPVPFQNVTDETPRGRSRVRRKENYSHDPVSNTYQPIPVKATKEITPEQQYKHDKTQTWARYGHYRDSKFTISPERARRKDLTADADGAQGIASTQSDNKAGMPDFAATTRPDVSISDLPRGSNQTHVSSLDGYSQGSSSQTARPPVRVFLGTSDGRWTSIVQSPSLPDDQRRRPISSEIPVQAGVATPIARQDSPELDRSPPVTRSDPNTTSTRRSSSPTRISRPPGRYSRVHTVVRTYRSTWTVPRNGYESGSDGSFINIDSEPSVSPPPRCKHRSHNVKRGARPGPCERFMAEVSVRDNLLTRAIGLKKSSTERSRPQFGCCCQ